MITRGKAKENANQIQFDNYWKKPVRLGPYTSYIWRGDPKHMSFLFSRYKFVSKMLSGKDKVLEIGCGDAMGTPVVAKVVKHVYATDFEPLLLEDNKERLEDYPNISFHLLDITKKPFSRACSAVYLLDVIEHIPGSREPLLFKNICRSLTRDGVCIIGTPNISARIHASVGSKKAHVNLKSAHDLQIILAKYFVNGFLFSMNDEIVHTGFYHMAQYLIAMGVGVK